jgi:hypothetical protein
LPSSRRFSWLTKKPRLASSFSLACHGSAYEIAFGSPKRIVARSAKRIAAGSAKRIADYWTDVWVAADAAAMTAKRTDMHRLQELVRLHRLGTGAREAARLLGPGPNTERRYRDALAAAGILEGAAETIPALEDLRAAVLQHAPPAVPHQQQSSLACLQERIEGLHVRGLGPTAIYDRLRSEDPEFRGSIGAVKRLVARIQRERGPRQEDVAIPVGRARARSPKSTLAMSGNCGSRHLGDCAKRGSS